MNKGVQHARSKKLILVNPDTIFHKNAINFLITKMDDEKIGVVGPQMVDENGSILPTISGKATLLSILFTNSFLNKMFPRHRIARSFWMQNVNRNKEQSVSVISGACMAMRKKVFEDVGGFDERFFMYFEETDLCLRVKKMQLSVKYFPSASIYHTVGASSRDKEKIESRYTESRYRYLKKYYGKWSALLVEGFLRLTTSNTLLLISIVALSLFLNLYRIDQRMLFIGDFGRDYLAARDLLLFHKVPLVGIQSSVVWLHQGPLSIYLIALALALGKFNPVAPAVLYGVTGVGATLLTYFLGTKLFTRRVGFLASLFYATSPLVVISARMPYHTSSIPLFSGFFFLILFYILKGRKKLLPLLGFVLGILLLLELSNAVLLLVIGLAFSIYKPKFKSKQIAISFGCFLLGILPFILYDLTHNFIQTLGFPLWVINRIRLFFGIAAENAGTTHNIPHAILRIGQQLASAIYPNSFTISLGLMFLILILFAISSRDFIKKKQTGLMVIALWLMVPLSAFIIHTAPGVAYFPLLFPALAIAVGYLFNRLVITGNIFFPIFILICTMNVFLIFQKDYFINTKTGVNALPPGNYSYGTSSSIQDEAAIAIASDSKQEPFRLESGGFMKTLETGLDNYKYLVWFRGGNISDEAALKYTIYEDRKSIQSSSKLFFDNGVVFVVKNERD
jgi:GT2 family glycosyltransferase